MSTAYPTTIDSYTTHAEGDVIDNTHVNNPQDAIVALQTKVGVDSSAVTTTLDYKVKNTASSDPGHKHTLASLSDFSVSVPTTNQFLQYNGSKWVNINPSVKFGGTGADGALSITSGTTTIDCASAAIVVKNYTSISITGSGALAFSNPNANGTTIILKSQGNVTITTNATRAIDLRSLGGTGGTAGVSGGSSVGGGAGGGSSISSDGVAGSNGAGGTVGGSDGTNGLGLYKNGGGKAGTATTGGAAGSSYTTSASFSMDFAVKTKHIFLIPGSGGGGGGGGTSSSTGGVGGRGAGALYIECGGAYSCSGTLDASGAAGTVGSGSFSGGGGGGGAGILLVIYATLTSDTGTYTVTAGAGATPSSGANGGAGGAGYTSRIANVDFP